MAASWSCCAESAKVVGARGSEVNGDSGRTLANLIDAGVAGDLVHPGAEVGAGTIGLAIAEDAEEDFLDQVFADGAVLGHFGVEVEERGLVAVEQHA